MPVDFIVLGIDCNPSCPIILGRPFLRTVGAIIDMKEGNIRFQFPLKKGMEHFPRKKIKLPYESIMRATVGVLGTGVPRLACLRPVAWLKGGPSTAHLHQHRLKTLARGQASQGGRR